MPGRLTSMCRAMVAVDQAARLAAIRGWAVNGHEDPGRQQSQQTPPGEPDPAAAGIKDSTIFFPVRPSREVEGSLVAMCSRELTAATLTTMRNTGAPKPGPDGHDDSNPPC